MRIFLKHLSGFLFRLFGWKIVGTPAAADKCIIVAAFHTSNWDFALCMGSQFYCGRKAHWLGKHTLFRFPLKFAMTLLGGVPVDRSVPHGLVETMTGILKRESRFILAIFPEGTRKRVSVWRMGFYQIALATGVPIQLMGLDYRTKTVIFSDLYFVSGDREKDLEFIRKIFLPVTPKYPQNADKGFLFGE